MPAFISTHERREGVDRNDLAFAALQLCRRWRATDGVTAARYFWIDPSRIFVMVEGEGGSLNPGSFNADPDNAAAAFALDDLARMTMNQGLADARAGQETYTTAGSPTGAS